MDTLQIQITVNFERNATLHRMKKQRLVRINASSFLVFFLIKASAFILKRSNSQLLPEHPMLVFPNAFYSSPFLMPRRLDVLDTFCLR